MEIESGFTVKVTGLLALPPVFTVTLAALAFAVAAITNVAVICVDETTVNELTVIPLLLTLRIEPAAKLVPVTVTGTLAPCSPLLGLIDVIVGVAAGFTVNIIALVVPAGVVTVTFAGPSPALDPTTRVAVMWPESTTDTALTVTPAFETFTVAPGVKLAPVNVTGTLAPWAPLLGLIEVSVGCGDWIVKLTAPLVPPAVVTVTLTGPAIAVAAIVNVTVIWAPLTTVTALAVIPLLTLTVAPLTKPVPAKVTLTVAPCRPVFGLTELSVGADGALIVNDTALLVPPAVVTVTFAGPCVAFEAIVKLAVICVELTTITLLTAMPLEAETVAPATNPVPLNVTGTVAPGGPLFGVNVATVGGGGWTIPENCMAFCDGGLLLSFSATVYA
jgi:hypothetical protein